MSADTVPIYSILPWFGLHGEIDPTDQKAVRVSKTSLEALGQKLIRGITYVVDQKFIEPSHKIEIFFLRDQAAQPIIDMINLYGAQYHRGPGIRIGRAVAGDDPSSALFEIEIWGKIRLYGAVRSLEG